jgi:hypothetical protein
MTRVGFVIAALAASFVAKHYATKMLEAEFKKALDKKVAEQNAPAN